jgi:hypothetical protein
LGVFIALYFLALPNREGAKPSDALSDRAD